ncbi:MAG TPA: extracellular solute-binding protein [Oscillospiraceae bacterium]|nr:extracellular solute-binding protein [Oscillospiraceae bacterium]
MKEKFLFTNMCSKTATERWINVINCKQNSLRLKSILLLAAIVVTMFSFPIPAGAEEVTQDNTDTFTAQDLTLEVTEADSTRKNTYSDYYDKYKDENKPMTPVVINAADYIAQEDAELEVLKDFEGEKDVLSWNNQSGSVTWEIDIPETGIYNLQLLYYPLPGQNVSIEMQMLIDGKLPYDTASRIYLHRIWDNEYPITVDENDNEIRSPQVEVPQWIKKPVNDRDGLFNEPLFFYLTEGKHEITLVGEKTYFALKTLTFFNSEDLPSYQDVKPSQAEIDATPTFYDKIEGEDAIYKTESTLYPTYDRTSYLTTPSHPSKMRYNTIGQLNWDKAGQAIAWEVVVPNDGYYKIGIKARQNEMRGFFSNRRIYIDGEVPYAEMDQVRFNYSLDWHTNTLSDGDEEMYVYLTAGKHTLLAEAVPGVIGDTMRRLDELVYQLNYYYRRILMITGPTPDEWNDYQIDLQLPSLLGTYQDAIEQLYFEKDNIESVTKQKGSEATSLESLAIALERAVKKPDDIPSMLGTIKDRISAVSAWMRNFREQPLEVDYIEISSSEEKFLSTKENFFKSFSFGFQAFIGSFFEDYNVLTNEREDALNVWVSQGRDQAQVVKELVDNDFKRDNPDIDITINLVQGSILEATLAGKGPDVAVFIGGDFPIQLAARGLLVDVSQFPDYKEVSTRFAEHTSTLFTYDRGVYALPVSQNFPMLFYRTDVLEELGITEPPETWDEFIEMLRPIQRNYMQAGLILPQTAVVGSGGATSTVTDAGHTFAMLLLQSGLNYYNEAQNETTFNDPRAIEAFETWTKFYTVYSFDQTYDAYSRFRTGEMPMIIQNYTFYNQLSVAAPEIQGLWSFCPVPGTVKEDGTISHATNSGSAGAIIFNKVNNVTGAWEFIKWFTSTEIQIQYGRTIEALMGPMGRFDAANLEALEQLPWSNKEFGLLSSQIEHLVEIPVIPASYSVTRDIMNAFRSVVNNADNARYALNAYNRDINFEIQRKREELGID